MATQDSRLESGGFVPFYRSYTKTWIHAVATAGLTAFGTLTIVHRWFAALALASYVVPPVVLYLRHGRGRSDEGDREATDRERASESATETEPEPEPDRAPSKPEPEPKAEPEPESDRAEPASRGGDRDATATSAGGTAREPEPESEPEPERETTAETTTEPKSETETEAKTPEWHVVDAPTDATLRDVVVTEPNGPNTASDSSPANASTAYAVGDGGVVLASEGDGDGGDGGDGAADEWTTVLEDGPAAGGNDLRGVDATADGEVVWVAGDSGALGRIDAETGRHTDYTAPEDITDNWLGVAVGGSSGAETVLLINGSGAILRGEYRDDGDDGDNTAPVLEWTGPDKPGSGSSFSGVALADEAVGYCCDTNDGVYETTDGGESFERIGLEGAGGTLTDVATAGAGDCLVSADDGVLHRYDGPTWTPERVADAALTGIARHEGHEDHERTAACTDDGTIYERGGPAADWERFETDVSVPLLAVSLAGDRGIAVGEEGTIVGRG